MFVSPVLAQMPERGDAWTDVAALSRRVHQIRGSILIDALNDRGSPSDENAWIREARQSVFATCGCSDALDDPISGWRQRDSRLMHGRALDISLGQLGPGQGATVARRVARVDAEAMRSGRKRWWCGRAKVSLDLPECRPNESGASGCRRLSGLAGAPQAGAAAEHWPADWYPAIPRSASHWRRQRPIHTRRGRMCFFFFGFFFFDGLAATWHPIVRMFSSEVWRSGRVCLASVCLAWCCRLLRECMNTNPAAANHPILDARPWFSA